MTALPDPASALSTPSQPAPGGGTMRANLVCMASMLVWAAALPALDFLIGHVPPVALTALRMGLAGLFLLPVWWLVDGGAVVRGANWLRGLAVGSLFAICGLCLIVAQAMTDVVTVSVIAAMLPVFGMGIEILFDGRRLTGALVIGIALSLVGGMLAYAAKLDQFGLGLGALAAMVSNLTYAMASRLTVTAFPGLTPLGRSAVTLAGAGVVSTVVALAMAAAGYGGSWGSFGWQQVVALLVFSIGGMAISTILWISAMQSLGLGVSSLHINAAAFYVMIFAWMLGAAWNWTQAAGALIVGLGVLVAQGVIPLGLRPTRTET